MCLYVDLSYDMQTNPSFGGTGRASATSSNHPLNHRLDGYDVDRHLALYDDDHVSSSAKSPYLPSTSAPSKAESTGHYFSSG